jgi:hypothetical protein
LGLKVDLVNVFVRVTLEILLAIVVIGLQLLGRRIPDEVLVLLLFKRSQLSPFRLSILVFKL